MGVSCPMSHDAEMQQRGVDTDFAFDCVDEGNVVSEPTASRVEGTKTQTKGEGKTRNKGRGRC